VKEPGDILVPALVLAFLYAGWSDIPEWFQAILAAWVGILLLALATSILLRVFWFDRTIAFARFIRRVFR
jgi:predicted permease